MVTKGIIQSIDFSGNTCTIRLPFFETTHNDPIVTNATFSNAPGIYNGYKANDVVWVAFEDGQMETPVVLGKLYLGAEKEKADPRGTINTETFNATKTATIPADTTLKTGTDKNIPNTAYPYNSLASVANDLNSLNKDVEYHNWYYENKIKNISSMANGKSTTYYSDADPSKDPNIILNTGDTWFHTTTNEEEKFYKVGPNSEWTKNNYIGYWIKHYLTTTEELYEFIKKLIGQDIKPYINDMVIYADGQPSSSFDSFKRIELLNTSINDNIYSITTKLIPISGSPYENTFTLYTSQIVDCPAPVIPLYWVTTLVDSHVYGFLIFKNNIYDWTEITTDNYKDMLPDASNLPEAYTKATLFEWDGNLSKWREVDNEIVANKLTVNKINAMGITAKKIEVLDTDNSTQLFLADGISGNHEVKIAGFNVDYNSIYNGDPLNWTDGDVAVSRGTSDSLPINGAPANTTNWAFAAGQNFGVTNIGALYASSGHIAGWDIQNNELASEKPWATNPTALNTQIIFSPEYSLSYNPFIRANDLFENKGPKSTAEAYIGYWIINPYYDPVNNPTAAQYLKITEANFEDIDDLTSRDAFEQVSIDSSTNWSLLITNNNGILSDNRRIGTFGVSSNGEVYATSLQLFGGSLQITGYDDGYPKNESALDPNDSNEQHYHAFSVNTNAETYIVNGGEIDATIIRASENLMSDNDTSTKVLTIDPSVSSSFTLSQLVPTAAPVTLKFKVVANQIMFQDLNGQKGVVSTLVRISDANGNTVTLPEDTLIAVSYSYTTLTEDWGGGGLHMIGPDGESLAVVTVNNTLRKMVSPADITNGLVTLSDTIYYSSDHIPYNFKFKNISPTSKTYGEQLVIDIDAEAEVEEAEEAQQGSRQLTWKFWKLIGKITTDMILPQSTTLRATFTFNATKHTRGNSSSDPVTDAVTETASTDVILSAGKAAAIVIDKIAREESTNQGFYPHIWYTDVTNVTISISPNTIIAAVPAYAYLKSSNTEKIDDETKEFPWVIQVYGSLVHAELQEPDPSGLETYGAGQLGTKKHPWDYLFCKNAYTDYLIADEANIRNATISRLNGDKLEFKSWTMMGNGWTKSDRRSKTDISYNISSQIFDKLKPASYKFIDDDEQLNHFGFIAQDVNEILDDKKSALVHYDKDKDLYYLGYQELHALEVHEIQELKKQVKELKNEIKQLKSKN